MIYMSAQMCEALNDLTARGAPAPPDLYDRFISWARPKLSRHYSHPAVTDHPVSRTPAPAQGRRPNDRGEHGDYSGRVSDSPGAAER